MDKNDIIQWLGDYINFWGSGQRLPAPQDFTNFNASALEPQMDKYISSLKTFLAGIPTSQLLTLFQETKPDKDGNPQHYIAQAFLTAVLSAPYWIWLRLNFMYKGACQPADLWNYFIDRYNQAYAISMTWASANKQSDGDIMDTIIKTLTTWNSGSQADIEKMAQDQNGTPVYKNCLSMQDIVTNAKILFLTTDLSGNGSIPDATPDYLNNLTTTLLQLMGATNGTCK